ncbi:MAG: hypothetical protein MUF18_00115 [Fimbriiglobus sp.]|jgi:protein SCO1/2|nr:hypothetical protein [Fimbriiglobus sp.]
MLPHHTLARLLAALVVCCATGIALGQNVGSYGMATRPPPPSPDTLEKLDIPQEVREKLLGEAIPLDGTFYDHAGHSVSLREVVGGKPTIFVPIYFRCPKLCSQTVVSLLDGMRAMREMKPPLVAGQDFNIVFMSIDSFEHPQVADVRRTEFHRDYDGRGRDVPGVWFLSANPTNQGKTAGKAHETITEVTDAIGFKFVRLNVKKQTEVAPDKVAQEIQHPGAMLVLTPTGRVSSYDTGLLVINERQLAEQIRTAGRGEKGSSDGRKSLDCFLGDDQPEGWYRTAMRVMAWSSVPVVAFALALVGRAWMRARAERITGRGPAAGE